MRHILTNRCGQTSRLGVIKIRYWPVTKGTSDTHLHTHTHTHIAGLVILLLTEKPHSRRDALVGRNRQKRECKTVGRHVQRGFWMCTVRRADPRQIVVVKYFAQLILSFIPCLFSYRFRQLALVLPHIRYVQSIDDHIKSRLPLHKHLEPLQLLNGHTKKAEIDKWTKK